MQPWRQWPVLGKGEKELHQATLALLQTSAQLHSGRVASSETGEGRGHAQCLLQMWEDRTLAKGVPSEVHWPPHCRRGNTHTNATCNEEQLATHPIGNEDLLGVNCNEDMLAKDTEGEFVSRCI